MFVSRDIIPLCKGPFHQPGKGLPVGTSGKLETTASVQIRST